MSSKQKENHSVFLYNRLLKEKVGVSGRHINFLFSPFAYTSHFHLHNIPATTSKLNNDKNTIYPNNEYKKDFYFQQLQYSYDHNKHNITQKRGVL